MKYGKFFWELWRMLQENEEPNSKKDEKNNIGKPQPKNKQFQEI